MRVFAGWVLTAILLTASLMARADAAPGKIESFTQMCSGNIGYSVVDIFQSRLAGSQTCSFALKITTNGNQGSITLTAPTITGTVGAIAPGAWYATCAATSDPSGIFTSLTGTTPVQLGASAITCATIASNQKKQSVTFTVALFLDDTGDTTAFPGDPGYGSSTLAVTANAP